MEKVRMCLLDETKVCDDCGECDRCDLDPNKICDNCCKCIAMEDEGKEFRSRIIDRDRGFTGNPPDVAPLYKRSVPKHDGMTEWDSTKEPTELTPELVEYWEKVLIEHGEAPADDGFGEIEVNARVPVSGKRKITARHKNTK